VILTKSVVYILSNKITLILTFVHAMYMLLEVVETGPYLFPVPTRWRSTLIGVRRNPNAVNTLLVPHKVIFSGKAFISSFTIAKITSERLCMLKHVFSVRWSSAAVRFQSCCYVLVI